MFAKQKPGKGKNEKTEKLKEIARMEAQIYRFAELLKEIRDDTVENVERKQANLIKLFLFKFKPKFNFRQEQMPRGRSLKVKCPRRRWEQN